jgi:hypothetical protein
MTFYSGRGRRPDQCQVPPRPGSFQDSLNAILGWNVYPELNTSYNRFPATVWHAGPLSFRPVEAIKSALKT